MLRFNAADLARRLIRERASELAAVLIDPMPGRAGLVAPDMEFISAIHEVCRENGILLIADEVLNLRQDYHGASARYGLQPDLITMGKIIGGGLPIGAIGGRSEVMAVFDSVSGHASLPQSGTFSANPLSMVAGQAAMQALDRSAFDHLDRLGDRLRSGLGRVIAEQNAPFSITGAASLFRIHPRGVSPTDARDCSLTAAQASLMRQLTRFFAANGILLPHNTTACLSTPMREGEVDMVVDVFCQFLHEHRRQFSTLMAS